MAVCREQRPPSVTVSPGHAAACWLHASDLSPAQAKPLSGQAKTAAAPAQPAAARAETPPSRPAEPSKEG